MRKIRWLLFLPILTLAIGCISTHHEEEKTGLFENDCKKMLDAFELVKADEKNGATLEDLEKIGFSLDAPNVRRRSGIEGMKAVFGEQYFDTAGRDPNSAKPQFSVLGKYRMLTFPFKDIVTTEDRFYFSTKNTDTEGKDVALLFVLEDDKVIYKAAEVVNIDKHESEHAFAEGLLNFIEKFGGSLGKIYDLLKKFKP